MKINATQAFIDGKFTDSLSGETFATSNPATGEVIAEVAACGSEDVDAAVESARRAFDRGLWSGIAPSARKQVMLRFADLLTDNAEELAWLDSVDAGKPITDCIDGDLPDVVNTIRWYAEAVDKLFGQISPTGRDALGLISREPVGVVGAVLPWNYPLAMLAWKLGPALASGNSVIVKPAELSPLSALRVAEIAISAGIPDGVLNVVPGLGEKAGKAIGMHQDIDAVTFTGSTEVGRLFLNYSAASNLKRVGLELGGKSPQIVMADAVDYIADVAKELGGAAFANAGQNCSAGSRILVQEDAHEALIEALTTVCADWLPGSPQDPATPMGPLIEPSALTRVLDYVEGARASGCTIAHGGHRVLEETGGWFVPPTIVDGAAPDMPVATEEIFGPVVAVIPFKTERDAIKMANMTPYGLASSLFTRDINVAHRVAGAVRAGTVSVNCYSEGDISAPFGGYKSSGFGGRDKGIEAFNQYTEIKTTWLSLNGRG